MVADRVHLLGGLDRPPEPEALALPRIERQTARIVAVRRASAPPLISCPAT